MIPLCYYRLKDHILHLGDHWDKLSVSENDAIEFAESNINKEPARVLNDEYKSYSMEFWLAHFGEEVNGRCRRNLFGETEQKIAAMLNTHSTSADLIVYRGVCNHVYKLMKKNARSLKGIDLFEKGFMATSLVKGHEINYKTKLRILIPRGTHCVFMGNVNYEPSFYEVTIQHGAALKILSADREYINCKLIKTG